jgi:hypothetical protein
MTTPQEREAERLNLRPQDMRVLAHLCLTRRGITRGVELSFPPTGAAEVHKRFSPVSPTLLSQTDRGWEHYYPFGG